jgi:hypothetical protein
MKTVAFSVVAKFPAKKVIDCFTNPAFAKLHTASKLFSKTGVYKADKKLIVRSLSIDGSAKDAAPAVAVITFTEQDEGKSTQVDFSLVNVPDAKADELKALKKIIADDFAKFLAPKPAKVAKPVAKAKTAKAGKKPVAKKTDKAVKPAAKVAKKPVPAKKPAAKKAVAKKTEKTAAVMPAAIIDNK